MKLDLEGERDDERVDIYVIGPRTWVREGPVEWLRVAHFSTTCIEGSVTRAVIMLLPSFLGHRGTWLLACLCLLISPQTLPESIISRG